jgi:hypothetical protein
MIMHHIALCTSCIALFNGGLILHIPIDHAEPESEFQAEQADRCLDVHKHQVAMMLTLL